MSVALLSLMCRPTASLCHQGPVLQRHVASRLPEFVAAPRQRRQLALRASASASPDMRAMVEDKNKANPVMVYSKTYCPYCTEVKALFTKLAVGAKVVELDDLADGAAVHDAVKAITGRTSVPQVFIGGAHIGGCDDTMAAYRSGQLKTLLEGAGVKGNF